jgi:hypothetical protein
MGRLAQLASSLGSDSTPMFQFVCFTGVFHGRGAVTLERCLASCLDLKLNADSISLEGTRRVDGDLRGLG